MNEERQETFRIAGDLGLLSEALALADSIAPERTREEIDLDIDAVLA